jgi:hypothetical protein
MGGTCCVSRTSEQRGRGVVQPFIPWTICDDVKMAMDEAESRLGEPPTGVEVFAMMQDMGMSTISNMIMPMDNVYKGIAVLFDMFREEYIYCNALGSRFTTRKQEGYETFSYFFNKMYAGYKIRSADQTVEPDTMKSINFNLLYSILKSRDESLLYDHKWMFDGEHRFLDGKTLPEG